MQRSSSFGTSWADQWDYGGDPSPRAPRERDVGKESGSVGEKTKAAAASGLRKVKEGTAQGFQWIKDKCQRKNGGKKQGAEAAGH
ncbi:uncharacterized protein LOC133930545 [Phragmites australis]|uniref:uncharacterized protein LOC133930545 n=1 Tax=Phragmites australis TaxID=29695 RepID=UPI002D77F2DD|nr:uncharacterized protein LOC133930545 [Phragmites australis]